MSVLYGAESDLYIYQSIYLSMYLSLSIYIYFFFFIIQRVEARAIP